MQSYIRIITFLFFLSTFFCCTPFTLYDKDKGDALAKVGSSILYELELDYIYTPQMSSKDSQSRQDIFIDVWIRNEVKIQAARMSLTTFFFNPIDDKVEQYREMLLSKQLEDVFISNNIDTTITNKQIEQYYNKYKSSFRLLSPLVKVKIAIIPLNIRDNNKLSAMFFSKNKTDQVDFINISKKNNYDILDFSNEWVYLTSVVGHMPFYSVDLDTFLRTKKSYVIEDTENKYLLLIEDYLLTGSISPLSQERENIREMLLYDRGRELLTRLNDSLYNIAYKNNLITRYYDDKH